MAAEALVRYQLDGLVTAIEQECLKMSVNTMFRIAQHDLCSSAYGALQICFMIMIMIRQTVPNDRCGVGE